jgi:type I restriction enzyme, S subunit
VSATRLKYIATLSTKTLDREPRPLVALEHLESGTGRLCSEPEIADPQANTGIADVAVGDVLFGKLRPYLAKSWVADRPSFASTELLCLRPQAGIDSRWLGYLVASAPFVEWAVATSDGTKMPRTSWEKLREFRVLVPELPTQHIMADYLDRETTRINDLIATRGRMLNLLQERWQKVLENTIWRDVNETTKLMHVVDRNRRVMYGIVLPGPDVGSGGIPIVKGGDVARRMTLDELCKTTADIEARYARARLRGGDLVFSIRGGIGDVAIVPKELTGANITQDVARVAPRIGVSPEWLMYVLETPRVQNEAQSRVTGATIRGLNIWELARLEVPQASVPRQRSDLLKLQADANHRDSMRAALVAQISLLREQRQALITAAVTGKLDVPEAT